MKNKKWGYILWIVFFILLICIPLLTNNYQQYIINLIFLSFLVCFGLAVLLGYAGQMAFASAGFLGIGAYTTGLSMVWLGVSYWTAFLVSCLVSLLFAIFLGFIGFRLRRYYLAITTLAFTLAMRFFYVTAGDLTFGPSGFNIPRASLFGFSLNTDRRVYYLVLFVVLLFSVLTRNIIKSKVGRAFMTIRVNEEAAASAGINVNGYKMLAFVICGILGGVTGALYTQVLGRIAPEEFGMLPMFLHFVIVVLGGLGSFFGLIISTVVVTLIPEFIRGFVGLEELLYGLIIIIMILAAPRGLYGFIRKYSPVKWREKMYGNVE